MSQKPERPENEATNQLDSSEASVEATDEESRGHSFSRRALIQAGWTVPVIMAVNPRQALASGSISVNHVDVFSDRHFDGAGHTDNTFFQDTPPFADGLRAQGRKGNNLTSHPPSEGFAGERNLDN